MERLKEMKDESIVLAVGYVRRNNMHMQNEVKTKHIKSDVFTLRKKQ